MSGTAYPVMAERARRGCLLLLIPLAALGLGAWAGFQFMHPPRDARALDDVARLTGEKQRLENDLQAIKLRVANIERDSAAGTAPLLEGKQQAERKAAALAEKVAELEKRLTDARASYNRAEIDLGKANDALGTQRRAAQAAAMERDDAKASLAKARKDLDRMRGERDRAIEGMKGGGADAKLLKEALAREKKGEEALETASKKVAAASRDLMAVNERLTTALAQKEMAIKTRDAAVKERDAAMAAGNKADADRNAALQQVKEAEARLAAAMKPEATDTLVVAMSSGNLSLHRYKNLFREFVDPGKRSLPAGCRIGMGLADGANWVPIVGFDDDDPRKANEAFGYFEPANNATTDNLNDVRGPVRLAFEKSKGVRRCVVVASLRCRPPAKSGFDDWKGLELTVILIGSEDKAGDLGKDRLREWFEFCHAVGGRPVQLLGTPKDPEDPDDGLIDRVRRALRHATQPRYMPGR